MSQCSRQKYVNDPICANRYPKFPELRIPESNKRGSSLGSGVVPEVTEWSSFTAHVHRTLSPLTMVMSSG